MTLAENYYYDGPSAKGSKQAILHSNQSEKEKGSDLCI